MEDPELLKIIRDNPIGKGLDGCRAFFYTLCEDENVTPTPDAPKKLRDDALSDIASSLVAALRMLPASRLLCSKFRNKPIYLELSKLSSAIRSGKFGRSQIIPLLNVVLDNASDDAQIWGQVYNAVIESTPPSKPCASFAQQTPYPQNTSSSATSEKHSDVDKLLKLELEPYYVDFPGLHEAFFGRVIGLAEASQAVLQKCKDGSSPLFDQGWCGWPIDAKQDDVLSWFSDLSNKLAAFAHDIAPERTCRRILRTLPNQPMMGSKAIRKLDLGFFKDPGAREGRPHWDQVLVPGEHKSNQFADRASDAWFAITTYAREVFAAQDTRRYVLGFTICGTLMRTWEFDRLGGIASVQFDINKDASQFVSMILGFLWMSEEELGYDPTINLADDRPYIEVERNGVKERLVIDGKRISRPRCIVGRATTCWKAYRDDDPQMRLVIKDSWQYTERDQEGELLCEATDKNVTNVARYYHHETVRIRDREDDIRGNVRRDLDHATATKQPRKQLALSRSSSTKGASGRKRSSTAGVRPSSGPSCDPPPRKKPCWAPSTESASNEVGNRVHRRVIVQDFGLPIYMASSRVALLTALEDCITGHESLLRDANVLHRDISVNNLMISEDNTSVWYGFLIDLDLAIRESRALPSGAKGRTGTRAFMAIGAILGEQHSFMHDLESFFWVLFWICIHYESRGQAIGLTRFDQWHYNDDQALIGMKKSAICDEGDFLYDAERNFTPHYHPLIPWVNRLREVVFPGGKRRRSPDVELYTLMKETLCDARKDPNVCTV